MDDYVDLMKLLKGRAVVFEDKNKETTETIPEEEVSKPLVRENFPLEEQSNPQIGQTLDNSDSRQSQASEKVDKTEKIDSMQRQLDSFRNAHEFHKAELDQLKQNLYESLQKNENVQTDRTSKLLNKLTEIEQSAVSAYEKIDEMQRQVDNLKNVHESHKEELDQLKKNWYDSLQKNENVQTDWTSKLLNKMTEIEQSAVSAYDLGKVKYNLYQDLSEKKDLYDQKVRNLERKFSRKFTDYEAKRAKQSAEQQAFNLENAQNVQAVLDEIRAHNTELLAELEAEKNRWRQSSNFFLEAEQSYYNNTGIDGQKKNMLPSIVTEVVSLSAGGVVLMLLLLLAFLGKGTVSKIHIVHGRSHKIKLHVIDRPLII